MKYEVTLILPIKTYSNRLEENKTIETEVVLFERPIPNLWLKEAEWKDRIQIKEAEMLFYDCDWKMFADNEYNGLYTCLCYPKQYLDGHKMEDVLKFFPGFKEYYE